MFFIKVRFSFSRYCNKYLLWSLIVSYQAGQTPARKKHCGIKASSGCMPGIGIGTTGFKYWNLQASEEEKILVIKHQTKKESQMVLCVFHLRAPWLASPQNVYTVAFVYLLSFLQDICSGIVLILFRLCASLYGSDVQNQWGNLRPNLKSQMEMSHKTSVSSPEAFYAVGLLWEGAECGSLWISSADHEGLFYIFFFHSVFTQGLEIT